MKEDERKSREKEEALRKLRDEQRKLLSLASSLSISGLYEESRLVKKSAEYLKKAMRTL